MLCGLGVYVQEFDVESHGSLSSGVGFIQGKSCSGTVWNFPNMKRPDDTFGTAKRHLSLDCHTPIGAFELQVEQDLDGSISW